MKRFNVVVLTLLLGVAMWVSPTTADAVGVGSPVVTSPVDGATVSGGVSEIGVDFTDAPVDTYSVTVSLPDSSLVASTSSAFDGSAPLAVLPIDPVVEPGQYAVLVYASDQTLTQLPSP